MARKLLQVIVFCVRAREVERLQTRKAVPQPRAEKPGDVFGV